MKDSARIKHCNWNQRIQGKTGEDGRRTSPSTWQQQQRKETKGGNVKSSILLCRVYQKGLAIYSTFVFEPNKNPMVFDRSIAIIPRVTPQQIKRAVWNITENNIIYLAALFCPYEPGRWAFCI